MHRADSCRRIGAMLRIALGQFNACVGDIEGNVRRMRELYADAVELQADLVIFPEMCVCGYPPEDLLLKRHFLEDNRAAVEQLAADCPEKTIIAGFAELSGQDSFNSLAVLAGGRIEKIYRKGVLPNYGVFDERRYFQPGREPAVVDVNGVAIVLTICEDIWQLDWLDKFLGGVSKKDLVVNISASPFHMEKSSQRRAVLGSCAKHFGCALAYCNLIGGQDELVFDGRSMILNPAGKVVAQAKAFDEDMLVADFSTSDGMGQVTTVKAAAEGPHDIVAEVYESLVLGTRDYVMKNGFRKVLIGLSGGIDSSLTAAVAVDALGAENVIGITMPSRFNKAETISDAEVLAKNLGIDFYTVGIESVIQEFDKMIKVVPGWQSEGIAYENLQARIRGTILMSLSNQFSCLVLTTGNKSETAVGYSTLYGDTAGGFAVIKDVHKPMVYKLSRFVNSRGGHEIIPAGVMERAPSAELKEDQKDSDSLPDYDLLAEILIGYIEEDKSAKQLIAEGLPEDVVKRVIRLVDLNEYKRRQSPPGVRITPKAFGKDRRMPITNRYTSR